MSSSSEPTNAVLLEKILNLGGISRTLSKAIESLRSENTDSHKEMIKHQKHTNGRVKKLELIYAGMIGGVTVIGLGWTVLTFIIK